MELLDRGLGWRPDTPDPRDHLWAAPPRAAATIPPAYRIPSRYLPPVWDQLQVGACTAFAALAGLETARRVAGRPAANPSRLFTYWTTRENEFGPGAGAVDSGATIRGVVKTLADYGTTGEAIWPYRDGSAWNVRPPEPAYTTAQARQVLGYRRVQQADTQIAAAVYARLPVVFGALIYEQMMDDTCARTGQVAMPSPAFRPVGGHAMLIVGYDFNARLFEVRNSWGRGWGRSGYCTFPMEYLTNPQLASDFWVIAQVES